MYSKGHLLKREHADVNSSDVGSFEPCLPRAQAKMTRYSPIQIPDAVSSSRAEDLDRHDSATSGAFNDSHSEKGSRDNGKAKEACHQCQQRKFKCSRTRPTCRFCSERTLQCTWNGPVREKTLLQVRSACLRCHKRKAKCSGERPACRFCRDRDLECTWDVANGATR